MKSRYRTLVFLLLAVCSCLVSLYELLLPSGNIFTGEPVDGKGNRRTVSWRNTNSLLERDGYSGVKTEPPIRLGTA